jgi:prepilin-type N-terminal cleavage/methylation domain-containing protein
MTPASLTLVGSACETGTVRVAPKRRRRGYRGFTLLELCAVMALAALTAGLAVAGVTALERAGRLEGARLLVGLALTGAERAAYASGETVEAVVAEGADEVVVRGPGTEVDRVALPAGVVVTAAPARSRIRFRASGLADNATVKLAEPGYPGEATIVVNQRGLLRW